MNDQNKQIAAGNKTNAMIQALDNTGIRMFMYYPQNKTIIIPKNTCEAYQCRDFYENMPQSFAEDFVCEDDWDAFFELYHRIDDGEKSAAVTFHSKDGRYCTHVTLTTVAWSQDGQPETAFGLIENWSDLYKNEKLLKQIKERMQMNNANDEMEEALKIMATAIGSQYFAVYYIWLESHTYVCFQEQLEGILSIIGEKGLYEPAWEAYITGYIEKKDQNSVRAFVDITTLAERIGHKSSITITYRRKEIGWTRGQFIVGKRDEEGMPLTVIYTVSDINEEMNTKLQKQKAEEEALRDPLTQLWNRKALEQMKEDSRYLYNPTGLMLFDIDRFKGINDQFGHDVGDQVLIAVANEMKNMLRQEDRVFRIGGDEFAVLLYDCSTAIWRTICRKIENLHAGIKELFPAELSVTISAGLCVNPEGYRGEMYKLADMAMYNTKINGRGGCSFLNLNGNLAKEWHDKNCYLRKGDILEKNSTVTWRMEIPKNKSLPVRVYGDDLYMDFLGLSKSLSPEETYRVTVNRLDSEYKEVLEEAVKQTISRGQAEAIYMWNHPKKGKVQFKCASSLDYEAKGYYSIVGYIHIMKDMHVVTIEDIHSKIKDALEELFFCNFYIRLSDYSFEVYKAQPYMMIMLGASKNALEAVDSYISHMVADESKETMRTFFDLTTLRQRMMDTNLLEMSYNDPNIGWSSAKFLAVDRDESGVVESVTLIVETI